MNNQPIAKELVLAGGGHSHVLLLRMLGMAPIPGLRVTLISPSSQTPYSGMLPGLIAGHYTEEQVFIDLVPLCRFAGAGFIRDSLVGLDPVAQSVRCQSRRTIRYDLLSLDLGITPGGLPLLEGVIPVKPISQFLAGWREFLRLFAQQDDKSRCTPIGFVGAGAGGVELCLAVEHYLRQTFPTRDWELHLFTDTPDILPGYAPGVSRRFEVLLAQARVQVHRDFCAQDYGASALYKSALHESTRYKNTLHENALHESARYKSVLVSSQGQEVPLEHVFWITPGAAPPWLADTGLAVDAGGFVRVRDTLQVEGFEEIFAVGDCATMVNHPRPKAGVYAVRQGKPLNRNLRALLLGKKLHAYRPQAQFLSLISTGNKQAVATRNGLVLAGAWAWRWKDWIDARFMQRFQQLPPMAPPSGHSAASPLVAEWAQQMHCGGCGAKVSSDLLREVLTEVLQEAPAGVSGRQALPSDDAALSSIPAGKLLLQTVDHFRAFYEDPYMLARIAVNHALSDIYACGGDPMTAMALLTLPFAKAEVTRGLLQQTMAGTMQQLTQDEVELVGGHTTEGVEMSIGFAISGLVSPEALWHKTGLLPGDALILTRALGTGVLFAADMQHRAKGSWVMAALEQMLVSNRQAAQVLARYPVTACTDVTGFGLAGHAIEMLQGTDVGLALDLAAVPILDGALACLSATGGSIQSTLHAANRQAASQGMTLDSPAEQPAAEIIFDPQTAGGLLVGLAQDQAAACVAELQGAGYTQTAVIGRVTDVPGLVIR